MGVAFQSSCDESAGRPAARHSAWCTQFDLNNIGVGDRIVVEQVSTHPVRRVAHHRQPSVKVDENMSEEITLTLIITTHERAIKPV